MKVIGPICVRHPELEGAQYARNRNGKPRMGTCIKCSNEQGIKWRSENKDKFSNSWRNWNKNNPLKVKEKEKRYKQNHKEAVFLRMKKWREKNIEYCRIKDKLKRLANLEKYKKNMKQWCDKNKEKLYSYRAKRRALKISAMPKWANEFFIQEAYHLARLRTKVTGIRWSVDHIVPLNSHLVCGLHCEQNLNVIPLINNVAKRNYFWPNMPKVTHG